MTARWIAVDWGTSNLRLWLMNADDTVIDERASDQGMARLTPDQFEPTLINLAADWIGNQPCDVLICGMAGARQGWAEAPYGIVPCPPVAATARRVETQNKDLSVTILAGLCQHDPADVMRGEETQIAGYLADNPNFDGIICLPGTHTKWVKIGGGLVQSFRTFMTGELFETISSQTILRHSVTDDWQDSAFLNAANRTFANPQTLTSALFGLRAAGLVGQDVQARAALSGLLIGVELAGAADLWRGAQIVLIGEGRLSALYQSALTHLGQNATIAPARDLTLRGLIAAYRSGACQ